MKSVEAEMGTTLGVDTDDDRMAQHCQRVVELVAGSVQR